MKTLLLDPSTTQSVSVSLSKTNANAQELYLIDLLGKPQQAVGGMKALIYVRPTIENVEMICREVREANYSEYHVFFSNILPESFLSLLAKSDSDKLIRQVHEYPLDYVPINKDLFTINIGGSVGMSQCWGTSRERGVQTIMERELQGLLSMFLSFKKPIQTVIASAEPACQYIASEVIRRSQEDDIYVFRSSRPTQLLVVDRSSDPVTPLLSQWTYQAMVHELLGMNNNRVILKGAPGVKQDLEEVVLASVHDPFYDANKFSNFGELGENIKGLLDEYQKETRQNQNISTIADMQRFMERYPAFRSQSHNVSKHVALMGELARLVDVCQLMDVSAFEQELACTDAHAEHLRELVEKLANPSIKTPDKVRLGLLYALRYENTGNVSMVKQHMSNGGVPPDKIALVDTMLRYAGSKSRAPGLYGKRDTFSALKKNLISSVQGVANVYSQHVPLLAETIKGAFRGRVPEHMKAYKGGGELPKDLFIYMVGGTTYEEARMVAEFNRENEKNGLRVILGGSTIHNSCSFLDEVRAL
ncbi:hypothetical protein TrCOL_g7546 [Triparma columacea]|nr:hypothetical protein TrCOL_g7546 [Triparma columacea]